MVVQEVFPDGLVAQDGRLQPGDQIIEVDGVDMTSATHQAVCQALRRPNSVLRLGVYRERIEAYRTSPHPGHDDLHGTSVEGTEQGTSRSIDLMRINELQDAHRLSSQLYSNYNYRNIRLTSHSKIDIINDFLFSQEKN